MTTPQKGRPTMAVGMVIEIEGALWRCRSFGERIAVLETVGGKKIRPAYLRPVTGADRVLGVWERMTGWLRGLRRRR